jgi:hypothetical protein
VQTYTVHEPQPAPEDIAERAERLVFIKEGFSVLAFIAPPVWLAVHRLWLELGVYIAATAGIGALVKLADVPDQAGGWAAFAVSLIVAFEARDLYRSALEKRGYALKAVVSGGSQDECEQRFLAEWLSGARADQVRRAAMPGLMAPGGASRPVLGEPVIGMFPAHGG